VIGVGECVPRPYVTGETFDSVWDTIVRLDLGALWDKIDGTSRSGLAHTVERLALPGLAARCAVELALLDLRCKLAGWRLADLAFELGLPVGMLNETPLDEIISVPLDLRSEPQDLAHLVGSRLGHLKIKVGGDLASDVRRVRECRALFGTSVTMSIDANMAWSVDDTLRAADALAPSELAWYEEPLQQTQRHRYRELRERSGIAVMLDESACSYAQTKDAIDDGRCDLINIRISKQGGYIAALRIAELALRARVLYQHGTQVGQVGFLNAAGRQFTSIVRGIVACEGGPGLANLSDFPTLAKLELDWELGHLVGMSGPGVGVRPDLAKLRGYAVREALLERGRW